MIFNKFGLIFLVANIASNEMNVKIGNEIIRVQKISITGDGACLYNMLSMAMFGSEAFSVRVRQDIVNHIIANYEEYCNFIIRGHYRPALAANDSLKDDENSVFSLEDYREHMMNPYSYGTFVELSVAANIFQTRICVFEQSGSSLELYTDLDASIVSRFGCEFIGDTYELNPMKPNMYGKIVDPLYLSNEPALEALLAQIQECYEEVFMQYNYNTVDDYLDLFETFTNGHGNQTFQSFFNQFSPNYQPEIGSVGLVIQLLNRITVKLSPFYGGIAKNIFMAASQEDVIMPTYSYQNLSEHFLGTVEGQKVTHVVGVVKFLMGSHLGHILLDSGYIIPEKPLVVMYNGLSPLPAEKPIYSTVRHSGKFSAHPTNQFFIVAKKGPIARNVARVQHLIYLGYSYCPAIQITKKFELLKFNRYLVHRRRDGTPISGIYFYNLYLLDPIYAAIVSVSSTENFVVFHINETIGTKEYKAIAYDKFDFTRNAPIFMILNEAERKILDKVAVNLGIPISNLYNKLKRVNRLMTNQNYLKQINTYAMMKKKQSVELYIKHRSLRRYGPRN